MEVQLRRGSVAGGSTCILCCSAIAACRCGSSSLSTEGLRAGSASADGLLDQSKERRRTGIPAAFVSAESALDAETESELLLLLLLLLLLTIGVPAPEPDTAVADIEEESVEGEDFGAIMMRRSPVGSYESLRMNRQGESQ